jgi:hypothetical protein
MITCPWCGTNYLNFQSNCDKCGGPMALPSAAGTSATGTSAPGTSSASGAGSLPTPPPPPRPFADSYAWRLIWSDGWGVVGFIFALLGAIFSVLGLLLTLGVITAFVGLPFLALGLVFLFGGGALLASRYQAARRTVGVLRMGDSTVGQIARVEENLAVRVNNQHPWIITYQFRVQNLPYEGRVTTLNAPGADLQPGQAASVLYLPQSPQYNSLYPHP